MDIEKVRVRIMSEAYDLADQGNLDKAAGRIRARGEQ